MRDNAALCASLMARSDTGEWRLTTCQDIDSVLRAWNARETPDGDAAVLHIGFDHPPSETFDEIACAHPGRLLLTAAAKCVLPTGFVTSAAPVATLGDAKVFVGLQGWGYSLEDPTVKPACVDVDPAQANSATRQPEAWVAPFLKEYPAAAETLSAHGLHDEASYIEKEAELPPLMRRQLGEFRFRYFAGADCDDLCKLVGAAPPWLTDCQLELLGLPTRIYNALWAAGIRIVEDLAGLSHRDIVWMPGFGKKSLRDTRQALENAIAGGLTLAPGIDGSASDQPDYLAGAAVPSWLTDHHLGILDLPARTQNVLQFAGIRTMKDLAGLSCAELLRLPKFGEKALRDIQQALEQAITKGAPLISGINNNELDPCLFCAGADYDERCMPAGAISSRLSDRRLEILDLPRRAYNTLWDAGIRKVGDLAGLSHAGLLRLPGFGEKFLRNTQQALEQAIDEDAQLVSGIDDNESEQLLTEINRSFSFLSGRSYEILSRHLGFKRERETLQEIADAFDATLGWVRKIEQRALRKLLSKSYWHSRFKQKITKLKKESSFPLSMAEIEIMDPWFKDVSLNLKFFRKFIALFHEKYYRNRFYKRGENPLPISFFRGISEYLTRQEQCRERIYLTYQNLRSHHSTLPKVRAEYRNSATVCQWRPRILFPPLPGRLVTSVY